jgi:hypothetical protein
MISGDLNPRLRNGRLIGYVTIVTVAAMCDPSSLMTIGLMGGGARSVHPFRRQQRSSRRQKHGDEKSDRRQVGSQSGHDAVLSVHRECQAKIVEIGAGFAAAGGCTPDFPGIFTLGCRISPTTLERA